MLNRENYHDHPKHGKYTEIKIDAKVLPHKESPKTERAGMRDSLFDYKFSKYVLSKSIKCERREELENFRQIFHAMKKDMEYSLCNTIN